MTDLQRRALARLPLSASNVELLFDAARRPLDGKRTPELKIICDLCESHERLRMELEGSAVLHDESAKALHQAAGGLERIRGGLLRIFARCDGWSAEDVKANVADLLGMTVQEVQAEIDTDTDTDTTEG